MKKIASFLLTAFAASTLFAFPIYAEDASSPASKVISPEVITCTQSAIESRDTAIIAAVDTYAAAVKFALNGRKDGLKAAWAKATKTEVRAALKDAWNVYKKALRDARKALKVAKGKAWNQFTTERKACKGGEGMESASPSADSTL